MGASLANAINGILDGLSWAAGEEEDPCPPEASVNPRSKYPPAKRNTSTTKKEAKEKAKRAGNGNEPVNHPNDPRGPHYHPGDGNGNPLNHDHYNYPWRRR